MQSTKTRQGHERRMLSASELLLTGVSCSLQVTFNQTNSQFYSQITWSACNNFAKKVTLQLMIEGYAGDIAQPSPTSVFLGGDHNLTANVTDIVTNEVGEIGSPLINYGA